MDNYTFSEDDQQEQVCSYNYFDFSLLDITTYVEYDHLEYKLDVFIQTFSHDHTSKCVFDIVARVFDLRQMNVDEYCMMILKHKNITVDIYEDHLSLNVPGYAPLAISNRYVEFNNSVSVWYILIYWLRVVRLNYYAWYMDYINHLVDIDDYTELKKVFSRPTIHLMLIMSEEAVSFWNYTMQTCDPFVYRVFVEYLKNVHKVFIGMFDSILSPMLFTRCTSNTIECHSSFIALFASGDVQLTFDGHGRRNSFSRRNITDIYKYYISRSRSTYSDQHSVGSSECKSFTTIRF